MQNTTLLTRTLINRALIDTFIKLNPRQQFKNPVMLVVYVGAIFTSMTLIREAIQGQLSTFNLQVCIWLWVTVLFANFAESVAEGRGKAQADSLRKTRTQTQARKWNNGMEEIIPSTALKIGDCVICETGDTIPGDGEVIEGIATVDESAITGESAPAIRESGGDRSAVTGGTRVISDRIVIRITADSGNTFIDRMISMVEGAKRQKTPNEIALTILLSALTIIFLLVVMTLHVFIIYSERESGYTGESSATLPILIALLVCLIPTTIGGLLSAIGISGMDRLVRCNVLATSGRAVEAAGDIDVLLLDKTGTITFGNRMASDFYPISDIPITRLAQVAYLSSLSDETPEGRSIVTLAKKQYPAIDEPPSNITPIFVPFSAQTRMSGVDFTDEKGQVIRRIRKGAVDTIRTYVISLGGIFPDSFESSVHDIAKRGSTPLVVTDDHIALGVIELKDTVKPGIKERFAQLRAMGIKTVMITGDNTLTATAIAMEAGVDDFMAQATPEDKLKRIRSEQENGHLVAMTGDGTNDAPALAQADVGVAMNTGTQAAREAGNMIDLDSDPTKLIEIVEIGKQLLMTRGALTTFSIANDVAKYFAILPALFASLYMNEQGVGALAPLNIMRLNSPQSAILSATIFNALIIIALVPLALRGVAYRPESANSALRRNLLIYGLGGMIAPFIGIKLIDFVLVILRLV